jgi:hypothetical protein
MAWKPEPDEHGRLFSRYEVEIRRNSDGVVRRCPMELWHSSSLFWWTDGNGACDCNRALDFARAGGESDDFDPPCGNEAFSVLRAYFPDGTSLDVDEAPKA